MVFLKAICAIQAILFLMIGACASSFYQEALDNARMQGMAEVYVSMSLEQLSEIEIGA